MLIMQNSKIEMPLVGIASSPVERYNNQTMYHTARYALPLKKMKAKFGGKNK